MPVPGNTPALTLGRTLFDKRKFRPDTDPAVIDCLAMLSMERAGAGWSGPAKGADEVYMAVYAQSDGGGAHNLYGGNPADPVNPFPLTVSASGSATVDWEENGSPILTSGTANFIGSGDTTVTVTDVATSDARNTNTPPEPPAPPDPPEDEPPAVLLRNPPPPPPPAPNANTHTVDAPSDL